jgi:hypothetical protein
MEDKTVGIQLILHFSFNMKLCAYERSVAVSMHSSTINFSVKKINREIAFFHLITGMIG